MRLLLKATLCLLLASFAPAWAMPEPVPDFCASARVTSVRNGAWSDPATWSTKRIPVSGESVSVEHAVRYDLQSDAALEVVCIAAGGTLAFEPSVPTRLAAGTVVVRGTLEMGRAAQPIQPSVKAELVIRDVPLDPAFDPLQHGTGLLVLDGTLTMHGAPVASPFVRFAQEPRAGAATLVTEQATGWRAGDEVVIPDSRHLRRNEVGTDRTERRRIASVQGTTLTLDRPLEWDHPGARNPDGGLERLPHIANVTRNVVVRSANPAGTRGHVLANHQAKVDVRYAEFRHLGRTTIEPLDSSSVDGSGNLVKLGTNQIGRYTFHLHHVWAPTFTLVGNAMVDGRKWGIAVHGTSHGLVKNNVVAFVDGAGIVFEDGNEVDNRVEGNFTVSIKGSGQGALASARVKIRDFGHEGAGIWVHGPFNHFDGNVAAASRNAGFAILNRDQPTDVLAAFPGANLHDPSQTVKANYGRHGQVVHNTEIYGGTRFGFDVWFLLFGDLDVRGAAIWHAWESGVFLTYTTSHRWADLWVRGDPAVMRSNDRKDHGIGMNWVTSTYVRQGIVQRADVQGYRLGFTVPSEHFSVSDSLFRNWVNMDYPYWADRVQSRVFERVRFEPVPQGPADHVIVRPAARTGRLPEWQRLMRTMTRNVYLFRDVTVNGQRYAGAWRLYNEHQGPNHKLGDPLNRTNAQAWSELGLAVGDAVAPCTDKRPGLSAFFCPVSGQDAVVSKTVMQNFHNWTANGSPAKLTYFVYDCQTPDSLFDSSCSNAAAKHEDTVAVQPGDNWFSGEFFGRRWSAFLRWDGTTSGDTTSSGSLSTTEDADPDGTSDPEPAASPAPAPSTTETKALSISPTSLSLTAVEGSTVEGTVKVESTGGTASVTITDDAPWLSVGPTTASTPATLTLKANASSLAPGKYTATVTASATGFPAASTAVVLNVQAPSHYALMLSFQADRSSPRAVAGASVAGNVYVFLSPESGVRRVRFYLDDPQMTKKPHQTENNAPWDFAGGGIETASPFDTTRIPDGVHIITAAIELAGGGSQVISTNFTVSNGGTASSSSTTTTSTSTSTTSQGDTSTSTGGTSSPSSGKTAVGIQGHRFTINGAVTYPGTPAEGLLMNVRMVNSTFEDPVKRPEFDPEANTDRFLAAMPDYVAHGIRAFTLNLQGGNPGYEGAVNTAFNANGSLKPAYLARVKRVIQQADALGAVVILGLYYQRQDQHLANEAAVKAGVVNVMKWLTAEKFSNVLVEIANEYRHGGFDHSVIKTNSGMVSLIDLARQTAPHLLVSASGMGDGNIATDVARASDFILIHGNGITNDSTLGSKIEALKGYGKPIVINEDRPEASNKANRAWVSVQHGGSWGLFLRSNQDYPFSFRGAADDPAAYQMIWSLTH